MFDVTFSFDEVATEVTVRLDTILMKQILAHAEARTEYTGRELDGIRVEYRHWNGPLSLREEDPQVERSVVIGVYKHGEIEYPLDEYGTIGWPDKRR